MLFSIIIPVYNVEKYLEKCLDSLSNQTYKDYETIIVNDGTTDNSQEIIDKYKDKLPNCKAYIKENGGLSDARNFGIEKASGDYLFFLDSDDYIDENLLEVLKENIEEYNNPQIIRFPKKIVNENGDIVDYDRVKEFINLDGSKAFVNLRKNRIILETAWAYIYRRDFWNKYKFRFAKGKIHEDLGLIPLVIISADTVCAISSPYYNYVSRQNSIITTKDYKKDLKKAQDILEHYDFLIKELNILITEKQIDEEAQYLYKYYITDALFLKLKSLKDEDRISYIENIKQRNALSNIKNNSIKSILKKFYYKFIIN